MGQRRRSREVALQVLYQLDMTGVSPEEGISLYFDHFALNKEADPESDEEDTLPIPDGNPKPWSQETLSAARPFAELLIQGVCLHQEEIDRWIGSASENWRLDRMSMVDRNILRIAVYEMCYCEDIPPKVSINEAIDLGKRFSSQDSGPFINGVLDQVLAGMGKAGEPPANGD
ncbi:MAG TPA: transcription antitermination factor NusB [Syntrophobacteraceae bacterium]|nr:transcription antitermination factor NusB [Syntrophobacteraceae bacterium]HBD07344.1 transcription antitermination factor NusB [Syntrophobacteraceae bacterium]HBZ55360.1 transcription antitermination factor NusB [Syntrophobacteraceae bacterium]